MYVVAGSTMVTPDRIRVVEGALAQDRIGFGQLQSIVHAEHLLFVFGQHGADAQALGARQVDQLRQVVLALRADAAAVARFGHSHGVQNSMAPLQISSTARSRVSRRPPRPCGRRCRRRCAPRARSRAGRSRGR